jgi:hypothetical protein
MVDEKYVVSAFRQTVADPVNAGHYVQSRWYSSRSIGTN